MESGFLDGSLATFSESVVERCSCSWKPNLSLCRVSEEFHCMKNVWGGLDRSASKVAGYRLGYVGAQLKHRDKFTLIYFIHDKKSDIFTATKIQV